MGTETSDEHELRRAHGTPTQCTPLAEVIERQRRHGLRLVAIAGEDGASGPLGEVIGDSEDHGKRIRKVEMTLSRWLGVWLLIGMSGGELLRVLIARMGA